MDGLNGNRHHRRNKVKGWGEKMKNRGRMEADCSGGQSSSRAVAPRGRKELYIPYGRACNSHGEVRNAHRVLFKKLPWKWPLVTLTQRYMNRSNLISNTLFYMQCSWCSFISDSNILLHIMVHVYDSEIIHNLSSHFFQIFAIKECLK
jgi:hypothetical protein